MKAGIRKDLEKLCHRILAADESDPLSEQLTQVQMLYERLLVINYLDEQEQAPAAESPQPESKPEAPPVESRQQEPAAPAEKPAPETEPPAPEVKPEPLSHESGPVQDQTEAERKNSLNDRLARGTIEVGLNDRLAFVKHLFGGEQEDFNRVLSQLNTAASYKEAEDFLSNLVKPDYDWTDKEEYEERLLELVRQKFGENA